MLGTSISETADDLFRIQGLLFILVRRHNLVAKNVLYAEIWRHAQLVLEIGECFLDSSEVFYGWVNISA